MLMCILSPKSPTDPHVEEDCFDSQASQHPPQKYVCRHVVWKRVNVFVLFAPAGISPRSEIPRRHPSTPDYAHARASSLFSSKDNRTVKLTRQDFLPDRTADRDLLFIFSSNILDFRRSLSSYIKIWLAVRRLIAILSLAGPPLDPKISFRSL